MAVQIPVSTKLIDGGKGFDDAAKAARQAAREAQQLTREQERAARAATAAQDRAVRDQVKTLNYRDNLVKNSIKMEMDGKKRLADLTARLDKTTGGGSKTGGLGMAGQFIAASAVMNAVEGLKNFTVGAVASAAAAERLGKATDSMALGFGSSGAAITESIQRASGDTIDQMAAMQAANQAMLLGVAKSPAEFDKLTRVAVSLGRAMGQDATKSIEDMTIGLGRQSKLILDNLGLMVNVEKANEKYAASVGKTVDQLTDAEKKQAFINEALAQGEQKMKTLGDQSLTTADKVDQLKARWSDFGTEFGNVLLKIGDGGALQGMSNFVGWLTQEAKDLQANVDVLRAYAKAREEAIKETGQQATVRRGAFGQAVGSAVDDEALANAIQKQVEETERLRREQEAAAKAAADQAGKEAAAAAAMEKAAQAADGLARKLEAANAARRDFAGQLIDITEQAATDTQNTWDDYFKEEQSAWQDHSKAVEKINADSEKQRVQIQKDLAKTLATIDKDLAKDLSKLDKDYARERSKAEKDGARQISRMQQDAAREEKQQRRQRQIDAKADQRLFDYDMRQLAAEGEFNQIQQAMERRAIEQQIAAEKTTEEDRARQENNRVDVQRAREDLQLRLAEMEEERNLRREELIARAEEERAMAQERAAEEEARRQEELAQALADEQQNYQERLEALRQARDEKLAAIEEGEAAALEKLAASLVESGDLTKEEMEKLVPIAREKGERVGAAFAEGMNAAYRREAQIDQMLGDSSAPASSAPSRPSSRPGAINQGRQPRTVGVTGMPFAGFADGIRGFVVPPGFSNDSYLVGLTSGERVDVTPAGQRHGGETPIVVNVNGPGGNELAGIIKRKVEEGVNEYHSNVIVPWSQG